MTNFIPCYCIYRVIVTVGRYAHLSSNAQYIIRIKPNIKRMPSSIRKKGPPI